MGHVGNEWELRYSPSGMACANNTIAVNRKFKNAEGELKEEVVWLKLAAFGKTAETLQEFNKKGDPLHLNGRLVDDSWTDKKTGDKRSGVKIIVEGFQFIGGKSAEERESSESNSDDAPPRKPTKPAAKPAAKRRQQPDEDQWGV